MSLESYKSSQEIVRKSLDTLTMEQRSFLFGFINLNKWNLEISWDLDQVLSISEDSVKAFVDSEKGTNYLSRRIDGWNSIARWLVEDGILNEKDAVGFENPLWINNDILSKAKPNEYLRRLSYVAALRNIPQSVTTVRSSGLRLSTYKWLDENFKWIRKGEINMNIGMNSGFEHKIGIILGKYKKNPELIHIDDDLKIIKALAKAAPGLGIIGVICQSDDISGIEFAENRVFLDRDVLNGLIYYGSHEADVDSFK